MDLNLMLQKHAEWKYKFFNAIVTGGKFDAATVSRDNACDFGKWLHASKLELGRNPRFDKCLKEHAAFHQEAGKVAAAINDGKTEEARQMMAQDSRYAEISRRIGVAIIELRNELESLKK